MSILAPKAGTAIICQARKNLPQVNDCYQCTLLGMDLKLAFSLS